MKKLYFLLASLLAFSAAQAQTFTFNYNDKAVEGTTLECNESDLQATPDAVGDQIFGYEIKLAPHISVSVDLGDEIEGALDADLNVKSLNGHTVQCCAGGQCTSGTDITKRINFIEPDGLTVNLDLEYLDYTEDLDALKEEMKNIKVELTIADIFEPEKYNKSLTVYMYGGKAGVSVIENNKYFRTAQGGFSYDLPSEAVVTLYNTAGVVCAKYTLSGSGFLSADELPAGIYVFTAEGEGVCESGKVAI